MRRVIPRSEWGARHDNGSGTRPLPARHVVLHHSVTIAPDLIPPFDDDYAAIRALEAIGEQRFGRGISYTRLFTPAGLIFEGHSIDRVGSHTAGYNVTGVGYCLVGNYETGDPTGEQLLAVAWCLQHDHANGWLDAPAIDFPHSAVKSTACPGEHSRAAIPTINQLAAGGPIHEEDDMQADEREWLKSTHDWLEAFIHGFGEVGGGVIEVNRHAYERMGLLRALATLTPSPGPTGTGAPLPLLPDNGEPLPVVTLLKQVAADIAELRARPAADVDEAVLAAELDARGISGVTAAELKEILTSIRLVPAQSEGGTV